MLRIERDRRVPLLVGVVGVAAALLLLDQRVSPLLRILPWVLVFGYPVVRVILAARDARR